MQRQLTLSKSPQNAPEFSASTLSESGKHFVKRDKENTGNNRIFFFSPTSSVCLWYAQRQISVSLNLQIQLYASHVDGQARTRAHTRTDKTAAGALAHTHWGSIMQQASPSN